MRPIEWLLQVTSERDGYARLLDESGGLAVAAWRLAEARCRTSATSTPIPSRLEVRAAARLLADKLGAGEVPSSSALAADLERLGYPVV